MQERIFVIVDTRFWQHLLTNSFRVLTSCTLQCPSYQPWVFIRSLLHLTMAFVLGLCIFVFSLFVACFYFLFPLPFFCKEMTLALWRSRVSLPAWSGCGVGLWFVRVISYIHGIFLVLLVPWTLSLMFVLSLFFAEVLIFTFIGVTLTPSIALQYFTMVISVLFGVYATVHDLHRNYNALLNETILCLESLDLQKRMMSELKSGFEHSGTQVNLAYNSKAGMRSMWLEVRFLKRQLFCKHLMMSDGRTNYISKDMYFFLVERLQPIRRQVVFVLLKITVIGFFSWSSKLGQERLQAATKHGGSIFRH